MIADPPTPRPSPPPLPAAIAPATETAAATDAPAAGNGPVRNEVEETRTFAITLLISCGIVLALAAFLDFSTLGTPSVCAFYRATGMPCGGCGLSRSCSAIAHGRFAEAWSFNPFGYFFMVLFIIGFVGGGITSWRPDLKRFVLPRGIFMTRLIISISLTLAIFGIWRLQNMVGWAGIQKHMEQVKPWSMITGYTSSTLPPVVLRHGDPKIPAPPPAEGKP